MKDSARFVVVALIVSTLLAGFQSYWAIATLHATLEKQVAAEGMFVEMDGGVFGDPIFWNSFLSQTLWFFAATVLTGIVIRLVTRSSNKQLETDA